MKFVVWNGIAFRSVEDHNGISNTKKRIILMHHKNISP